jgi:hypothetical protein
VHVEEGFCCSVNYANRRKTLHLPPFDPPEVNVLRSFGCLFSSATRYLRGGHACEYISAIVKGGTRADAVMAVATALQQMGAGAVQVAESLRRKLRTVVLGWDEDRR